MAYPAFGSQRNNAPAKPAEPVAPASCPSCGSTSVVSTAKVPDVHSYWRCAQCGEVWNPARMMSPYARRWQR